MCTYVSCTCKCVHIAVKVKDLQCTYLIHFFLDQGNSVDLNIHMYVYTDTCTYVTLTIAHG